MEEREIMFQDDSGLAESAQLRNELFYQLSHPMRRRILRELVSAGPGTAFSINDPEIERPWSESDRLELRHNHLPRLTAVGYVRWDRETDTITRGPLFGTIAPVLTLLMEYQLLLPAG
ncbi:helix-turn-helix domain-containing protein [Natrinema marinum]|uniref:helix-turn-helix domain-containing protein n=1 Tax=Natrinema marinum TaxID=2961598 RepID=UPI0020C8DF32|nr:helix-turn-helix domain-containing protein [Natrinema marinum]